MPTKAANSATIDIVAFILTPPKVILFMINVLAFLPVSNVALDVSVEHTKDKTNSLPCQANNSIYAPSFRPPDLVKFIESRVLWPPVSAVPVALTVIDVTGI